MAALDTRWDASRLRAACEQSGESDEAIVVKLQELIELANAAGSDLSQVRLYTFERWKRGANEPRARHAALLARALGVKLSAILPALK